MAVFKQGLHILLHSFASERKHVTLKILQKLTINFALERNVPTKSVKDKVHGICGNNSDINSVQPLRICLKFFLRQGGKEGEGIT